MSNLSRRSAEVESLFRRSLGAIHFALVELYRLTEEEAAHVAENLCLWFERFAERGSSHEIPVSSLRLPLLVAVCRVALTAQLCKLDGRSCEDDLLKELLARAPEDVAYELEEKLQREEKS